MSEHQEILASIYDAHIEFELELNGHATPVSVPVSRALVSIRSPILRTAFACTKKEVIQVPCKDAQDVEAGQKIIELMHELAMPMTHRQLDLCGGGLSPALLLKMIRWADLWDAPECLGLCAECLMNFVHTLLHITDINGILALPDAVLHSPSFSKGLLDLCSKGLLHKFGNVHEVISKEELRVCFTRLAFPAVKLFLSFDELAVHSENDVAVLCAFWYDGKVCDEKELKELSELLRVARLSPSFRADMLPRLNFFLPPSLPVLTLFNLVWDHESEVALEDKGLLKDCPPGWFAPARSGVVPGGADVLDVRFEASKLSALLQAAKASQDTSPLASPSLYYCGYFWVLKVCLLQVAGPLELELSADLSICPSVPPLPAPSALKARYSVHHVPLHGPVVSWSCSESWFKAGTGVVLNPRFLQFVGADGLTIECQLAVLI